MPLLRASLLREYNTLAGVCVLESNCSWLKSWPSYLLTVWPWASSSSKYLIRGVGQGFSGRVGTRVWPSVGALVALLCVVSRLTPLGGPLLLTPIYTVDGRQRIDAWNHLCLTGAKWGVLWHLGPVPSPCEPGLTTLKSKGWPLMYDYF